MLAFTIPSLPISAANLLCSDGSCFWPGIHSWQYSLSSQAQFRSKEISKSSVVDDMVAANPILYKTAAQLTKETGEVHKKGEHPDHIVVIKHVPAVGDSSKFSASVFSTGEYSLCHRKGHRWVLFWATHGRSERHGELSFIVPTSSRSQLTAIEHLQRMWRLFIGNSTHIRLGDLIWTSYSGHLSTSPHPQLNRVWRKRLRVQAAL